MEEKRHAGILAASFVKDGMTVGLGTGSTVYHVIVRLGERVKEGLRIRCVSTSEATTELAESLGLDLIPMSEVLNIDMTIDGADEVDRSCNGIKGGGGALLHEKLVAGHPPGLWCGWLTAARLLKGSEHFRFLLKSCLSSICSS